jgi:hypothetical protein
MSILIRLRAERPEVDSRQVQALLESTRALSLCVKRPGREADHSSLSSVSIKPWNYISTPPYVFMAWCLVKYSILLHGMHLVDHRDNKAMLRQTKRNVQCRKEHPRYLFTF